MLVGQESKDSRQTQRHTVNATFADGENMGAHSQSRASILVVDDNADIRDYIRRLLTPYWHVTLASDGIEALEKIRKQKPSLVLSDIIMPNLDGFGLLKAIRSDPALQNMPVIFLSAGTDTEIGVEGLNQGANDYLSKPFNARELIARIRVNLHFSQVEEKFQRLYHWEKTTRAIVQRIRDPFHSQVELLSFVVEQVGKVLNADRCFIFLHDRNKKSYVSNEYTSGPDTMPLLGQAPSRSYCPYNERCEKFEFTYVEDAWTDETINRGSEWFDLIRQIKMRGVIGAPVQYNQELLSAMFVHTHKPRKWEEFELNFVQTIADQLAITLYQIRTQEELERISKYKSHFLSAFSHELRSPLNSVIGFTEMALQGLGGPLTPKQEKYLTNAVSSGKHLLDLINDILDISKIESGKMTLNREHLDMKLLISELENLNSAHAVKRNIQLIFELDPNVHSLYADRIRIKQILLNLINNAIKFNKDNGKVMTRVVCSDDQQWIIIEVEDTGVGIPRDKQMELFKEFYQVDNTYARQHEGSGLGLNLAKKLVELHGGTISVWSEEGVGSAFTVQLPVHVAALT